MEHYWFEDWLREFGVRDERTLRQAINHRQFLESLLEAAPPTTVAIRKTPSEKVELTGGKGIDLTGELGCRHIDCLSKEIDSLFRHAWHYFDTIRLPDQSLYSIVNFNNHRNVDRLAEELWTFFLILKKIRQCGGEELVEFEVRIPSCREHLEEHAREANIAHAFANTTPLVQEIATLGVIIYEAKDFEDHKHLDYRLEDSAFDHTEWGTLCGAHELLPEGDLATREAIATHVVRKYLAGLSADALAARHSHTALGATIRLYRRLLAKVSSLEVEDIAFDLALPVSPDLPVEYLIKLRQDESQAFQRFQNALRVAITERLKLGGSHTPAKYSQEITRDVIEPELRGIRDRLAGSQKFAMRRAATGIGLGVVTATVGLLNANPIGVGLAVGGAITLGAQSIKNAIDDLLSTQQQVSLSDMYFLWKAHEH